MPEMISPQDEVLRIPVEGVQAMRALGWELSETEDVAPAPKSKPRRTTK